ncbi:hypothetical protein GUJ93_ZPchr0005g15244 [Zizania palustris]|uniref:Uncharacterized protein n=1 Tax=Zizania palustris TaxID=103762 RepID=A0A8J5VR07_ZIZPA|nr:hypothetical protein GUJ93_ZPchr0005g15244 [Zizania palustris]
MGSRGEEKKPPMRGGAGTSGPIRRRGGFFRGLRDLGVGLRLREEDDEVGAGRSEPGREGVEVPGAGSDGDAGL